MSSIKILAPGGYTTVQDRGRFGFQHMGVPMSGALDQSAFTLANLLVGNPEDAGVLELTVMGPSLEIMKEMDMALTGADMGIRINDEPKKGWRSIRVFPGDIVTIGQVISGCRSYLAFSGGISVPRIMGSLSTYTGGQLGGFQGRPLKKDDVLHTGNFLLTTKQRKIPARLIPDYPSQITARVIPGPQDEYFDQGLATLFRDPYMVTAKADRMGYRLQGEAIPIKASMPKSIVSEPSMPGSIQIPADEQPIILLVEQTVGGYAKIATLVSTDISRVAQATPGDFIGFEKIDLATAHSLVMEEMKKMAVLKEMLG
ncbi:biotin-dependent carboxyltransferase family protein [Desulfospira joergensenii]|uniref:5-oxoprolinase subunit C family protein n=1 Tax=Desulfospira joergensenii TaxID=53329 RepID=UPI0003B326DD|nr:biotin-dependent carboxyltransferase family protein [Desulfospira joergensenii]